MPRGPHLDFAGALHHVIVRGIERRRIFRGDTDRQFFLNRLADWVIDSRAGLYAWALMPNHAISCCAPASCRCRVSCRRG